MAVAAATAVGALTALSIEAYKTAGRIVSISEMLVNAPPPERAEVTVAIMLAMITLVISFAANYRGSSSDSSDSPRMAEKTLNALYYICFCVSSAAVVVVVAITYRELMPLHFTAAGFFFIGACVALTVDMILEFKYRRSKNCCRRVVKTTATLGSWCSILLLLLGVFTYKSIPRIDRRPPFVIGEFVGTGSFILHCLSLMPIFNAGRHVARLSRTTAPLSTRQLRVRLTDSSEAGILGP